MKDLEARMQTAGQSVDRIVTLAARESEGVFPRRVSITEIAGRVNKVDMQQFAERELAATKLQGAFRSKTMSEEVLKSEGRAEATPYITTDDLREAAGDGGKGQDKKEEGGLQWVSVTELNVPDEAKARIQQEARGRKSFTPVEGRALAENINDKMDQLAKKR